MDYSEDEKKAMRMVGDYFRMVEGMILPKTGEIPSQNRKEMIAFLEEKEANSEFIFKLNAWMWMYEHHRKELRELSEKRNHLERDLYALLRRSSFD